MPARDRDNGNQGSLRTLDGVLRARGERPTRQRRAIYSALIGRGDHPSAEALFRQVRRRVPGMSLATVYTTLDVLVRAGLAGRMTGPDGVTHYDARIDTHDHRRCLGCGRIEDIERPSGSRIRTEIDHGPGFRAVDCRIEVVGYCAACDPAGGARIESGGLVDDRRRTKQEESHDASRH
jgi:Fur family peroxide stress response transcriptional regulator